MTARWHLGPITGWSFWWLLVTSPEILIFLFFMITDPMTIPKGRVARVAYAVFVGLLATLLIAPQTTEYATKVSVLAALALVCVARPLLERALPLPGSPEDRAWAWARGLTQRGRAITAGLALAAAAFAGLVVVAGIPARGGAQQVTALPSGEPLPQVTVTASDGISSRVDAATANQIARDIVLDLRTDADALRLRDPERAAAGAGGAWLVDLRRQIGTAAGRPITVSSYRVSKVGLTLTRGVGQGPPRILAAIDGDARVAVYRGQPPKLALRRDWSPFERSLEVALQQGHYVIVRAGGAAATAAAPPAAAAAVVRATGALARRPAAGRRLAGRPRLSPGRLPLRRLERHGRHDGRRRLLARLRRRRLARPVRRQLVRQLGSGSLGAARRTPSQRPLPQREGLLRGRRQEVGCRPRGARGRLRGGRPQRRRPHGPRRHDGLLRQAPLEQRRRDVHGRREGRRDRLLRLAFGRSGGRRQRRRPTRSVRRRLHGPERSGDDVDRRLPHELPRRARPPVPQRGQRRARPLDVP